MAPRRPGYEGRSLLDALLGEPLARKPVYAELLPTPSWNHRWRALISGGKKLIEKLSDNTTEVFDLRSDPTEQKNLAAQDTELQPLKKTLASFLAAEGF